MESEVIATDTDQKGIKGICLCKQETHVEASSRTIVSNYNTDKRFPTCIGPSLHWCTQSVLH